MKWLLMSSRRFHRDLIDQFEDLRMRFHKLTKLFGHRNRLIELRIFEHHEFGLSFKKLGDDLTVIFDVLVEVGEWHADKVVQQFVPANDAAGSSRVQMSHVIGEVAIPPAIEENAISPGSLAQNFSRSFGVTFNAVSRKLHGAKRCGGEEQCVSAHSKLSIRRLCHPGRIRAR